MSIAELNHSLHAISAFLDVEDGAQDPDSLRNNVLVYSTDDITRFNNILHDPQNGAGCAEVSSNDGLDNMDVVWSAITR